MTQMQLQSLAIFDVDVLVTTYSIHTLTVHYRELHGTLKVDQPSLNGKMAEWLRRQIVSPKESRDFEAAVNIQ